MTFHNTTLRNIGLTMALLLTCLNASGHASDKERAGERAKALKTASSPSDSIRILLDVYNLSDKISRDKLRLQIINITSRSDKKEVIYDVLKELSASTDDTKDLARLLEISDSLPDDEEKQTVETVLNMEKARSEVELVSDSQVTNQLVDYTRQGMSFNGDIYKEIQNIYRAMVYLGAGSQGPLYQEYILRLNDLVEDLPEKDHAIRNLFYTTAAIFYTRRRDYQKAIDYDRKLLSELDFMKKRYEEKGLDTDEINYFYFVAYRRMLRNFRGLTPEEVENVYRKCVELVEINDEAAKEFGSLGLANSYYFMATGQYGKAVPELKKALSSPDISDFRRQELLGLLAEATRNTGDTKTELEALRGYTQSMLEEREERRAATYRELEMRNSVNKLIADEFRKEQQQRKENRVMRQTSLTLVYVLGVILIFIFGAYMRLRNKVKELENKNSKLRKNIEYIFDDGIPKGAKDIRRRNHGLKG